MVAKMPSITTQSQLKSKCSEASQPRESATPVEVPFASADNVIDVSALKIDILASVRNEIAEIFKSELQATLGNDLATIKSELHALKTELSATITSIQSDVVGLKSTVGKMEESLTTCTDDVAILQGKVESLEVLNLANK